MKKPLFLSMVALFSGILGLSCENSDVPLIAVEVSPLCIELGSDIDMTQQFNATIFVNDIIREPNPDNSAVIWSVDGGDINGTISNAEGSEGLYTTSPVAATEVTIVATSIEDNQKQGRATVVFDGSCEE